MNTASARRPSAARAAKPRHATPNSTPAEPTPFKQFVATIEVDGRDLQTVTEWWAEKPAGVWSARDPETGQWLTTRIWCPVEKVSFYPYPA